MKFEELMNMVQAISALGLKGIGVVGTLVVAGIVLVMLGVSPSLGEVAIGGGIFLGLIFGLLGVIGVLKRVVG